MTPERWQQIKAILDSIADCTRPLRDAEVQRLCNSDPQLRAEVESFLAGESRIGIFERGARRNSTHSVPEVIGPYQVIRLLGSGGMGSVYLAERADEQYRKQVAIKLIQSQSDRLVARFRSERQILASLEHPYIARLLDGGLLEDGRPYLVMEYVEGRSIDEYVAERNLPLHAILRLFLNVCSAVQFAHQNLIVHRDLKPGNILITASGEPRLLDFGIAKVVAETGGGSLDNTEPFERILTPTAASPEQLAGAPVTTASDVYSLAVLLYALLTGRSPYAGAKDFASNPVRVISEYDPPAVSATPGLTRRESRVLRGDIDTILSKGLEKDPSRRYATVDEFAADIENYLEKRPVRARPASLVYRANKFVRRNRIPVAAVVAVALAIAAGTGASVSYARRANIEKLRAQRRFEALRTLSESLLFEFHDSIQNLPGSTQARAIVVRRAVEYLDRLRAESDENPIILADLASAYHRLALIQSGERVPHLGGAFAAQSALDSNRKALAIRKQLLAARPDDQALQQDVLDSSWAVAEGVRVQGDLEGALKLHFDRLGMVQDLISKHPRADLQYNLSASFTAIGDLYRTLGDNRTALDYIRKSLAVRESLLRADPQSERARRLTGQSREFIGYVLAAQGDYAGAASEHAKAVAIFEPLAVADPANAPIERLLMVAENNMCESLAKVGAAGEALKHCRSAIRIAESMAKSDKENAQAGEDLASAYSTFSVALQAAKQDRAAVVWEQRADELYRNALARDPDSMDVTAGYIDSLLNLAEIDRRLNRPDSCQYAAKGRDVALSAVEHAQRDKTFRSRLARAEALVARCRQSDQQSPR